MPSSVPRTTRRVTVYRLGKATEAAKWDAFPELNCVVVRALPPGTLGSGVVDLTTGDRVPNHTGAWVNRHRLPIAVRQTVRGGAPPFELPVLTADPEKQVGPHLRVRGSTMWVENAVPATAAQKAIR